MMRTHFLATLLLFAAFSVHADEPIIDRATRDRMADAVAQSLTAMYVEPDVAPVLAAETKRRILTDAYLGLTPKQFAEKLTKDMQEQTGDGHLYVRVRAEDAALPVPDAAEVERTIESLRQMMRGGPQQGGPRPGAGAMTSPEMYRKMNYGFVEARVLEGNIGLLRIDRFAPPLPEARAAADAALAFIANTTAVILDLRACPGGNEAMATYLLSHFFAEEHKLLITATFRFAGQQIDSYTTADVPPAKRRPDVPLYVLTSRETTFSAAEFVAYTLQKFGRAKVVGETTRGGGYAVQMVPIGHRLMLAISVGKPVHPVTKGGWQKVGVVPDVAVVRDAAVDAAVKAIGAR
jgi:hypothetical protein